MKILARGKHLLPSFLFTFHLCRECGDGVIHAALVAARAALVVVLR